MKKVIGNWLIGLGILAANLLHAQEMAAPTTTSIIPQSPANLPLIESYSDAQLQQLISALAATPLIWPTNLPEDGMGGTYWSLVHPDWPPLPATFGTPVWNLSSSSASRMSVSTMSADSTISTGSSGFYLLDDVDYPPSPGTNSDDSTNVYSPGFLTSSVNLPTTNDLWLQILSVSNGVANLVIHPPWNQIGAYGYDVYYTTNLSAPIAWQWVAKSEAGQTNLTMANATDAQGFYKLGLTTSTGMDFWLALFDIYETNIFYTTSLYISSATATTGTVYASTFSQPFSLAAGSATNITIPDDLTPDYDIVEDRGIEVTSSAPVSVYGVYFGLGYSGAATTSFSAYPTTMLGTNYCLMAYPDEFGDPTDGGDGSQFSVVAMEDGTTVTITPSTNAYMMYQTNVYLNQGQTYQVGDTNVVGADVTGTKVTSDKPVAVFAGVGIDNVPNVNVYAANPLLQEQLPVEDWGTNIVSMSFAGRKNGDSYRILSAVSSNAVTISGIVVTVTSYSIPWTVTTNYETFTTNLMAGVPCDLILDGPVQFKSTQPIQVAQFANGNESDLASSKENPGIEGDPCELLLPPTGCYLETNVVVTLANNYVTGDFDENFLNLIVPQSATNATHLDGSLVASTNFAAIGNSGYYSAQVTITNNGAHTVTSSQPVGVEVYGWGYFDAYSYFGGTTQ